MDDSSVFTCFFQGASALFDMIEYYESATHLNISFNKHIGTRGWQAAAHMMRKVSAHSYKHGPAITIYKTKDLDGNRNVPKVLMYLQKTHCYQEFY